jgi:signal transduction histidine kinase/HD-like signal output (HDOD) protein
MLTTPPDQDRAQQIEVILRQVDQLPTLSPIAVRLLQIGNVEDADLDGIVEVIESDPALTARLLGLCRRADKGLGDRITTVRRAVVMLGLEAVQAAALSVAVYELMEGCAPALDEQISVGAAGEAQVAFDRPGFWKHSIAVACAGELIAEAHAQMSVKPEEAFVGGLLHDLGKLVMDLVLPRSYARVLGLAECRAWSSAEAELRLVGLDHHTIGKRVAEHWGLPAPLRDAMWLHGQPLVSLPDGVNRNLIGIVGVARHLTRHLHLGWSGDYNHPEPLDGPRGVCDQFGLSAEVVEKCIAKLHENVSQRCAVLGLGEATTPELLMQAIAGANRRLGRLTATFEQRARAAQRQARVLAAISEFHAAIAARPGRGVVEMLAEVVRSATSLLGKGFFGVVYQLHDGDPWQLCQFGSDGRPTRSQAIEAPPGHAEGWHGGGESHRASLAALTNPAQLSMGAMSLLPWLTDYLLEATDLRDVQLLSLTVGAPDSTSAPGPAVVLLHDREVPSSLDRAMLGALTATWGAAIANAAHQEASRRMGERLAAATRSLAETQQRLAETESMARLGEMAAGAAHEMNNPLTVISGRAQLLASAKLPPGDAAAAQAIVEASQSLSDLITSLRLLADPPVPRMQSVPLEALARTAVDRAEARAGSSGRCQIAADAGAVEVDKDLIATAVSEMILNALQAGDGPVRIKAHADGAGVTLEVHDSGCGMSPRALRHAFDPFFSEKPAGRRTGLGLTRARRLAELHSGDILLDSAPGKGTTATLRIPLHGSGRSHVGPKTEQPPTRAAA